MICKIIEDIVEVEKIYLFGSYAYGTPTEDSDFDLCVIIPDNSMRQTDAVKQIRRALFPVQTTPLDVIVYHADAFRQKAEGATLERKIKRDGILLYGRRKQEQWSQFDMSLSRIDSEGLL